ncbi:MAG: P-II family nitrogen regulator [Planctomycetes bacterium]|nr:P-II family nitrogen regulator [Planctomycetota bacterium]
MKIVVAVIKPFKLDACLRALAAVPTQDLIHSEARGYGRQKDHLKDYRDDRFAVAFLPKIRLEFTVENEHLKAAIEAIYQACRSGRQGDGKIWVLDARAITPQAASA